MRIERANALACIATLGIGLAACADIVGRGARSGASAAKTPRAAPGIDQALLEADFTDNGTIEPIASTIVGPIV